MWVHLLVIALLVYILWLVTQRRNSMYRSRRRYFRIKMRNVQQRINVAQKAKSLQDLVAMYQARMSRAGSKGNKKLVAQYQKVINRIQQSGTLQNYIASLKNQKSKLKVSVRKTARKVRGGMRRMGRAVRDRRMQMPVGNYYFYFNTVPAGGPTGK